MSGIELDAVYGPADAERPGEYPYTRGPYASMYRQKLWTMRQFAGFGTAEDTNERFRALLAAGGSGLSTAFDMPTLLGRDSDHELALGEVGRAGVAVDTLADVELLFAGIDLGAVSTSMTINSAAPTLLAMYVALGDQHGVDRARLGGTIQNDILKEYQAQKEFVFPPRPSMRLVTDVVRFATAELPRWHPVSISGYHIREAGSTAAQELAFTLANGFAYVESALAAGLDVDAFAPRLSFFFNAHVDFFEEIAKYRAACRIWARWMRDEYGARDERSQQLRFHTQTAGVSLTAQQPEVNIARVALEAMAAVLGGTQSLHTDAFDEALALPTERAAAHRAAHAAGHRARIGRRARGRPARRLVVRRSTSPTSSSARPKRRSPTCASRATARCSTACCARIDDGWFQARDRRRRLRLPAARQRRRVRDRRRERPRRRRRHLTHRR